ncbi:hypothetical protein ACFDTO_37100 [Microbacteriaceae bacterium 4G12]
MKYLFKRLIHSPLLLGWILIGTAIEFMNWGKLGPKIAIINLILLALFTIIIKLMTDQSTVKPVTKIKYPKLELFSGILLYIFMFIITAAFWGLKIPYISSKVISVLSYLKVISVLSYLNETILKLGTIGIPQ